MPLLPALLRLVACLSAALLIALPAGAQDLGGSKVTGEDIRNGLIWSGHLGVSDGDPAAAVRDALQSWQKAKGYKVSDFPSDEQISELVAEGEAQRAAYGWARLEDKSIGFSIGVPTKLVKFKGSHTDNGSLVYDFEGAVRYTLLVRYGDLSCSNLDYQMARLRQSMRATYRVRYGDGYALAGEGNGTTGYLRAVCRTSGVVIAAIDIPTSEAAKLGMLIPAMADSLSVGRHFNPTSIPRPKMEQPPPVASDIFNASASKAAPDKTPSPAADGAGKTATIKREAREGKALTVEQVFDKVSPAVFVVRAGPRMGSAVAISDHELLTNCHVVKEEKQVKLHHDKVQQTVDVVSIDEKADRCILRSASKLDSWVAIRTYDDIKVGERVMTVGAPQGLELTVAEGVVSSKRTDQGHRFVQTTAPISQGSSGGGLFDAEGHLLGITTFYLRGGQNLNFAIAAEDFAK